MSIAKFKTPKGTLEWVFITGEGKENLNGVMQYVADLVLDEASEECKLLTTQVRKFWEDNKPAQFDKEPKSLGFKAHKDEGRVKFSFKTGTSFPSGDAKVITVFNSKGNKVDLGGTSIGNGSEGRIAGAMAIYTNKTKQGKVLDAGVTFYLDAIQVTKLVEYNAGPSFSEDSDGEFTGDDGWEGTPEPQQEQARL